jgi:hypothetical protein
MFFSNSDTMCCSLWFFHQEATKEQHIILQNKISIMKLPDGHHEFLNTKINQLFIELGFIPNEDIKILEQAEELNKLFSDYSEEKWDKFTEFVKQYELLVLGGEIIKSREIINLYYYLAYAASAYEDYSSKDKELINEENPLLSTSDRERLFLFASLIAGTDRNMRMARIRELQKELQVKNNTLRKQRNTFIIITFFLIFFLAFALAFAL